MSRSSIILAACHFLGCADLPVSRRSVQAFLRHNLAKGYSTAEVSIVVAEFNASRSNSGPFDVPKTDQLGPLPVHIEVFPEEPEVVEVQAESTSGPSSVLKKADLGPLQVQEKPLHVRASRAVSNYIPSIANSSKLRSLGNLNISPNGEIQLPFLQVLKDTEAKPLRSLTSWIEPLKRSAWAASDVLLAELTVDERFAVGRYHALKFMNCSVSESKNKKHGLKIAATLAAMGQSRDYGLYTVKEYFDGIAIVSEMGGGLVRNPWDFRAALEYGSAVTA